MEYRTILERAPMTPNLELLEYLGLLKQHTEHDSCTLTKQCPVTQRYSSVGLKPRKKPHNSNRGLYLLLLFLSRWFIVELTGC